MTDIPKKKILWLSHFVPFPPNIGAVQRSYNLLRETAKYHDVTVLAFNQAALLNSATDLANSIKHLQQFCRIAEVFPIPTDTMHYGRPLAYLKSIFTANPFTLNWLMSKQFQHALRSLIDNETFDLVYFDTISLAPYRAVTGDIPCLLNHHNIESDMMRRRARIERNPFKKAYILLEAKKIEITEKKWCPQFNLNITCSPLDNQRLLSHVPDLLLEVIPNGVDFSRLGEKSHAEKKDTLVFAGGMAWYPNRAAMEFFAMEVWPLLTSRRPGIQMTVVGPNPPESLISQAQKDTAFKVTGFVDDVRPYIDAAAVYICPIFDGGGTKLKVLEALAMGKALVAHPVACEGIDVINGKSVVFAETPAEFTNRIIELLDSPDKRHILGENGKRLVLDHYSYSSIGMHLARLIAATAASN